MRRYSAHAGRRLLKYRAGAGTCEVCTLKPKCTPSKKGREVLRYFEKEYVDSLKVYRETFPYEKALRKRRVWIEPLIAEAKDWHSLRRFRLRGLEKVNAESLLITSGQNVKGRQPLELVIRDIGTGGGSASSTIYTSTASCPQRHVARFLVCTTFFNGLAKDI